MKVITHSVTENLRELGSKFIGYLFPCASVEEFTEQLNQLRAKYPDATHHCYAWRIAPNNVQEFSSDDGEPSGTAGLPILNQLKSYEVVNAGAVVVRYFGGTKLGKAGLIEAYGATTKLCLDEAILSEITAVQLFEISYPYSEENLINRFKNQYKLTVLKADYLEQVTLRVACVKAEAPAFEQELMKTQHLGVSFEKGEESFI